MKKSVLIIIIISFILSPICAQASSNTQLSRTIAQLKNYDDLAHSQVMVVATSHFDQSVLTPVNQSSIQKVLTKLSHYQPTKIILEWEPSRTQEVNSRYRAFLNGRFAIADKPNEVYQLGFQLAKKFISLIIKLSL